MEPFYDKYWNNNASQKNLWKIVDFEPIYNGKSKGQILHSF